ncbi:METL4 protein, partial [Bucco capensis]|nr:METL4 protein [Bucco capensis]
MSVVHRLAAGWLVDHLSFINQCGYELWDSSVGPAAVTVNTSVTSGNCPAAPTSAATSSPGEVPISSPGDAIEAEGKAAKRRYVFREEFFAISKPYIAAAPGEQLWQRCPELIIWICFHSLLLLQKGKRKCELNQGELEALQYHSKVRKLIWEGTSQLVQEGLRIGFLHHTAPEVPCRRKSVVPGGAGCGLAELCEMAKQFAAGSESDHPAVLVLEEETSIPEQDLLSCVTENSSNSAKILVFMGQKYLVPPRSSFLLSDISCLQPLLNYKKRYDVIVIDPPWENKSVKRSKRYSSVSCWQLQQVPVPALAAPGCLLLTWVTNRQRHLRFVREQLYPHWAVKTLTEWHWVKITRAGEFVLPLDSLHKKPYEVLVLGRFEGEVQEAARRPEEALPIPEHKLIVSVPCSLHSHKPPLAGRL